MLRLLAVSILLVATTPAFAATFTGTLESGWEAAPTAKDPKRKVEVYRLVGPEGALVLAELDPHAPLTYLVDRGPITLEGELVEGRLQVERIAAPSVERFKGTLSRTRKGMGGQLQVRLEGTKALVRASGLPWLLFRQMTKDMSEHRIEFDAFPIRSAKGELSELVVTRVKAQASEGLVLTRNLLSYRGEVAKGTSVWLTRRSLMGHSAFVEGPDGKTGFALLERLQVGERVGVAQGAADRVGGR